MRSATTLLAASLLAFCAAVATPAAGAEPPCLTARLIVPWGAGSGTDLIFRALADAANRAGAKPRLEVVNISGQEGVRGTEMAAKARPDGCTLLAVHQSLMTSYIAGQSKVNWQDLTPVARLTRTPMVIGARAGAEFSTVPEMLEAARGGTGVSAASTEGLASHFLILLIEDRAKVAFRPVFMEGTRERLSALLNGSADIGEVNQAIARRLVPGGLLKAIAVTGPARIDDLPDVPTLREQGVELTFAIDRGVMLPKGAKPDLAERYAKLFDAALGAPDVQALLKQHGTAEGFLALKAYAGYWQDTFAEWRRVAKDAGLYRAAD